MRGVGGALQVTKVEGWRANTVEKDFDCRGREWRTKELSPTLPTNNLI